MAEVADTLENKILQDCRGEVLNFQRTLDAVSGRKQINFNFSLDDLRRFEVENPEEVIENMTTDECMLLVIDQRTDLLLHDLVNLIMRWRRFTIAQVEEMTIFLQRTHQTIQLNPNIHTLVTSESYHITKLSELFIFEPCGDEKETQSFAAVQRVMNSARFELFAPIVAAADKLFEDSLSKLRQLQIRPNFQKLLKNQIALNEDAHKTQLIYDTPSAHQKSFDDHLRIIAAQIKPGDILHITFGSAFKLNPKEILPFDVQKDGLVLQDEVTIKGNKCYSIHIDPGFIGKTFPTIETASGQTFIPKQLGELTYSYAEGRVTAFIAPICFDFLKRDLSPAWQKYVAGRLHYADVSPGLLEHFLKRGITVCLGLHLFDSETQAGAYSYRTLQHRYEDICRKYPGSCFLFEGSCNVPFQISNFSKSLIPSSQKIAKIPPKLKSAEHILWDYSSALKANWKFGLLASAAVVVAALCLKLAVKPKR